MLITKTTLDALRTDVSLAYAEAYDATETWHEKVASTIPSSSKSNTYAWAAESQRMREWIGPRMARNLSEHSYVITNRKFEVTEELPADDIEDDNLGVFEKIKIPGMATANRKHPDELIAEVIAANPACFDGEDFFSEAHPVFDDAGSVYSNDLSANLDGDGFESVWATMASRIGENGLPLRVNPRLIIVPPQLYRKALTIMQSTTYAAPDGTIQPVDNVMKGWADVLMVPELAADPTVWYIADVSKAIKPFVYQTRMDSGIVARDNINDPKVFDLDVYTWGIKARRAAGVSLPFLISRVTEVSEG